MISCVCNQSAFVRKGFCHDDDDEDDDGGDDEVLEIEVLVWTVKN